MIAAWLLLLVFPLGFIAVGTRYFVFVGVLLI